MALEERETVVVDNSDRNAGSWIIPLIIVILLILAFFYFGGFGMFGGTTNNTETINVDTPEVQVQPTNP